MWSFLGNSSALSFAAAGTNCQGINRNLQYCVDIWKEYQVTNMQYLKKHSRLDCLELYKMFC